MFNVQTSVRLLNLSHVELSQEKLSSIKQQRCPRTLNLEVTNTSHSNAHLHVIY